MISAKQSQLKEELSLPMISTCFFILVIFIVSIHPLKVMEIELHLWRCFGVLQIRGCHSPSENRNFPEIVKVRVANLWWRDSDSLSR